MRETGVMIMRHHKPRVEHPRSWSSILSEFTMVEHQTPDL